MSQAGAPGRRLRSGAGVAAAALGVLAVGAVAAPMVQEASAAASTTVLRDGSVTGPARGAIGELGASVAVGPDDAPPADPGPVTVAAGMAARSDGPTVLLSSFAGAARTDSSLPLDDDVLGLALSPAGDLLAAVDATGSLSLFAVDGTATPTGATSAVDVGDAVQVEVATSGDGSSVAVAAAGDDLVRLVDRTSGAVRDVPLGMPVVELAPGAGSTVHVLTDTAIVVLDAAGGVALAVESPAEGRSGIALIEDGASVAVWDEQRLLLLDARSLDAAWSYAPTGPVFAVADGQAEGTIMVAVGGSAPRIALVELASGRTLSEIGTDLASFAAVAAAGAPASLLLATPRGIAVGSWEASRVAWQAWWAIAAILAVLAIAAAIVALRATRIAARGEGAATLEAAGAAPTADLADPRAAPGPASDPLESDPMDAHLRDADPLDADPPRPVVVEGSIHDRMRALRFATVAPATPEGALAIVAAAVGAASTAATAITIDAVLDGPTVTGSVRSLGVRMATFVVALAPAPDGGTHARFRVDRYRTAPAMVPFAPDGLEERAAYGPLRDFAVALADALEEGQP